MGQTDVVQITIADSLAQEIQGRASEAGLTTEELLEQLLEHSPLTAKIKIEQGYFPYELVDLISDALLIIDENYRIVDINEGARNFFGYSEEELIGQLLDILLSDRFEQIHRQHFTSFLEDEQQLRHMNERQYVEAIHKDGSIILTAITLVKYQQDSGLYAAAILKDMSQDIQVMEQLINREEQLHILADNFTDIICLHQADGIYQYISPSLERITGYKVEELLGKNPYDYVHPDDIAQAQESHQAMLAGDNMSKVSSRFRRKSGDYVWLETITKSILDTQGAIKNLVTVSRDISEEKGYQDALEMEHNLLQSIMDSTPSAITVVEADGRITYANKRAEDVLGIRASAVTERTYDAPAWKHTDYDGNPLPDEKQPFVRVLETKQPVWDVRHAIEKPDGELIYLVINGIPILNEEGEVVRVVFAVEDYTQRKIQQDQLKEALAQSEQLNEMKTQFISMVSHEFRTPLAVITTTTRIMRMKYEDMNPDLSKRVTRIEDQVRRLTSLLEEVTSANRAATVTPQLVPIPINLANYFQQLIQDMEGEYPNKPPIKLIRHSKQSQVMLDAALLQHIFVNLLSNAMKYSYPDGQVTIEYSCYEEQVEVIISDEGIGIPVKDQPHLFTQFHRAENVGAIIGTGLGLFITKKAVEAIGGSIRFESELNVGTRFTVTLPAQSQ